MLCQRSLGSCLKRFFKGEKKGSFNPPTTPANRNPIRLPLFNTFFCLWTCNGRCLNYELRVSWQPFLGKHVKLQERVNQRLQAQNAARAPSALVELLVQKSSWGELPSASLQEVCAAAVKDGATHPEVARPGMLERAKEHLSPEAWDAWMQWIPSSECEQRLAEYA
eukprot:1844734-Amphidinium_carterae.2